MIRRLGLACLILIPLLSFRLLLDYHLRIFGPFAGFSRRAEFSLQDSLPALSPGLGELEAFKLTADPSARTNADRSIWLADSLGALTLEYHTGKSAWDSTLLYLWTSDSVLVSDTVRRKRTRRWSIPYRGRIRDWTEVVGVYVSRPRFLNVRSADSSVALFQEIEGKTLHLVRRRYRDRGERVLPADTSYPLKGAEGLQLWAKDDALAIANPSARAVEVRVIRVDGTRWDLCRAGARSVAVYRGLFRGLQGPVLAYTEPGRIPSIFFKNPAPAPAYFWWDAH